MPPARRGAAGGRGGQAGQLCRRTPPSQERGWRRPLLSPTVRSPGAAGVCVAGPGGAAGRRERFRGTVRAAVGVTGAAWVTPALALSFSARADPTPPTEAPQARRQRGVAGPPHPQRPAENPVRKKRNLGLLLRGKELAVVLPTPVWFWRRCFLRPCSLVFWEMLCVFTQISFWFCGVSFVCILYDYYELTLYELTRYL